MRLQSKNWSIGNKMVFLGIVTTLISFGAILLAVGVVITQYAAVREQQRNDYQTRVDNAVKMTGDMTRVFAEDYAYWDEMYAAVGAEDHEWFVRSTTGSLETFKADIYWIYNNQGKLIYQDQRKDLEAPIDFSSEVIPSLSATETTNFFENQSGRTIHFTAAPILDPTNPEEASNGFMIVAQVWDVDQLDSLGKIIGASVIYVPSETSSPIDEHVHIFEHFKDVHGKSVSVIEATFVDRSLQLVRNSLFGMIVITFFLGGGLIFFSYQMQYHWFVDPVLELINKLKAEVDTEHTEQELLTSHNEMEVLRRVIDDHIEKLRINKRLSLTVEASTNGIAITNNDGNISYVNAAWSELNGYTRQEAIGQNPRILHSGKTPSETYTKMWEALTAGKSYTTESIVNRRKDGTEYDCRLSVYPITENGKAVGYVGIQQNISHRKEVDRMKTEFISMASHQLRTPLSAMRWFGELLLQKKAGDLNPKQTELVQNFYDSTLRMISLVNSLLNISRIESGRMIVEPVPTHLEVLVDTILTELSARIDAKKLKLHKEIAKDLPVISVDPQLVREVYSNLLTNAVKYTPEGGEITLKIEERENDIRSSVTDTGVGIPKGDEEKVFSKFFRAKNVTSFETDGTGLGLYLVKTIVNSSNGEVGFASNQDHGSTFWFTLPKSGMTKKDGSVRIS